MRFSLPSRVALRGLFVAYLLVFFSANLARAQAIRYEAGRRLRAFEIAWGHTSDAEARCRALVPLQQAVNQFLGGKEVDAARSLDKARLALRSADAPSAAVEWAESLSLGLGRRLADVNDAVLPLTLKELYASESAPPSGPRLKITVFRADDQVRAPLDVAIERMPLDLPVPLSGLGEGDFVLRFTVTAQGKELSAGEYRFSLVERLDARLTALSQSTASFAEIKDNGTKNSRESENVDELTTVALVKVLTGLARGDVPETDYPAARLLAEAEAAVVSIHQGTPFYGKSRDGQFWLRLPLARQSISVRVFVPSSITKGEPLPLVVALHGAGGSENLFFDGYGKGAIVDECRRRGWLLVSPRTSGFGLLPVQELIAAMSQVYPVDKNRVFVVGHSMGAMQTSAAAQATPELFAAVAALGGGGVAKASEALKRLPYYVAAGSEDFALTSARRLEKNLRAAGVETLEFHEYPAVEHLLIVQEALPEVFRFFDAAAKRGS